MADIDTSGFIKNVSDDFVKVNVDRRRYKPEKCAPLGGFRGFVIAKLLSHADIAKNPDNPDGEFWDIVIRLSRPCPVVGEDNSIQRAEAGEDILVVAVDQLKSLLTLAEDPKFCAEVEGIPLKKVRLPNGRELWRFNLGIRNERITKGSIVPELGLLNSFKDEFEKLPEAVG